MSATQVICPECGEHYLAGVVGTRPWPPHECSVGWVADLRSMVEMSVVAGMALEGEPRSEHLENSLQDVLSFINARISPPSEEAVERGARALEREGFCTTADSLVAQEMVRCVLAAAHGGRRV